MTATRGEFSYGENNEAITARFEKHVKFTRQNEFGYIATVEAYLSDGDFGTVETGYFDEQETITETACRFHIDDLERFLRESLQIVQNRKRGVG